MIIYEFSNCPYLSNFFFRFQAGISLKDLALERGFEDDIQAVDNYGNIELYARKLFRAAATGDIKRVKKYNKANYRDKASINDCRNIKQ